MTSGGHWPFTGPAGGAPANRAERRAARKGSTRFHGTAAYAAHARTNRLIVGGRAHVRKRGLS